MHPWEDKECPKDKGVCARDRPDAARGLPSRSRAAPGRVRSWTRVPCENSVRFNAITRIHTIQPRAANSHALRYGATAWQRVQGASLPSRIARLRRVPCLLLPPTRQSCLAPNPTSASAQRPAALSSAPGAHLSVGNATATPHRADTCAEATAVDACRVALPPLLPLPLGW